MKIISPKQNRAALFAAFFVSTSVFVSAAEIPEHIVAFRHDLSPGGNLDVKMSIDAQHDLSLRLEPSTEPLGQQLNTHQMWKLDQIRAEAPDRFRIIQRLFPRQIAEYLLRQGTATTTAGQASAARDSASEAAMQIAARYLTEPMPRGFTEEQLQARREIVSAAVAKLPPGNSPLRAVLDRCARDADPDFSSAKKAGLFLTLRKQYSPFNDPTMSVAGDTLMIGGKVVSERLRTDAAVAGQSIEQFAQSRRAAVVRELAQWREGQISGDAYAGTIKSFLNDPRLADFSPAEIHAAYARIFGRDLKTDIAADRLAAKEGRLVTYAEMMAAGHN